MIQSIQKSLFAEKITFPFFLYVYVLNIYIALKTPSLSGFPVSLAAGNLRSEIGISLH